MHALEATFSPTNTSDVSKQVVFRDDNSTLWIPLALSLIITLAGLVSGYSLADCELQSLFEGNSLITLVATAMIDLLLWGWAFWGYCNKKSIFAESLESAEVAITTTLPPP